MKIRSLFFIALFNVSMAPAISTPKISWPSTQTWLKFGIPCTVAGAIGSGIVGFDTYNSFCREIRNGSIENNKNESIEKDESLSNSIYNSYCKFSRNKLHGDAFLQKNSNSSNQVLFMAYAEEYPLFLQNTYPKLKRTVAYIFIPALLAGVGMLECALATYLIKGK